MSDPGPPRPEDPEAPRGADLWLAPFFRDSSLWPVLVVAVAIFVLFGAWGLLLVFVDHSLFALAAVLLVFWMSVDVLVRNRRSGGSRLVVGCVLGFWALAIAAAAGARLAGWY